MKKGHCELFNLTMSVLFYRVNIVSVMGHNYSII